MGIEKPSWLRDALASGWLNLQRGQWVNWQFIVVPPISFTPGLWIETAIDWVVPWINSALTWGQQAWNKAADAWNKALEALGKINNWLSNTWAWFFSSITSWWESTKWTVLGWVENVKAWFLQVLPGKLAEWWEGIKSTLGDIGGAILTALIPFKPILDFWNWKGKAMVDFFGNPQAYIAALLGDALGLFLKMAGWPFLHAIEFFLDRIWEEEENEKEGA